MEQTYNNEIWNKIMQMESIAAVIVNSTARIQIGNKGFFHIFSMFCEDYIEKSLFDLIDNTVLREKLFSCIKKKIEKTEFVFSYSMSSDNVCWYRVEVFMLVENTSYLLLFFDLTEAYQAQMIMEAHSMVSDDIFMFFDQSDHVLHCSDKAARIFGFSSVREAMGVHYTTFMRGKVNLMEVEKAFVKLHQQEEYLGYVTLQQQESNCFYEISGWHVNLRAVSVGYVLLFKLLGAGSYLTSQSVDSVNLVKESADQGSVYQDQDKVYAETRYLFWNSEECKEGLRNLRRALEHYEYIEINELLEQIIVLAPENPYTVLQNIQKAIMAFEYEKALSILSEAHFIMED